ncbi:hypothetical protein PGTUg99_030562 [Puccinia graminis f. sp. tritici]|uniref:Uncharacterized protein n=1 Tax=Puccinia graminis f. sp. tritici TaxID=56615 RepID=A0A5B0SNC6_PUCGR|nr:hypothetical protein PGTUg99_030562 [Puccinia graminis f. sp. tritici]
MSDIPCGRVRPNESPEGSSIFCQLNLYFIQGARAFRSEGQAWPAYDSLSLQTINRPTSDSSCSNLNKHALLCGRKHNESQNTQSLANLGITGTGDINPSEVPQLCAIWCAEAARSFSSLVDASHKAILHPTVVKHLPPPSRVSKDIHLLYSAIQDEYRVTLNGILRPFGSHKKDAKDRGSMAADNDSDGSISEQEDPEDQIRVLPWGLRDNSPTSAGDDSSDEKSEYGADLDDNEVLNEADIENASKEEEDDRYTLVSCKRTLAKFCAIAKKLRYSPTSKAEFIKICQQKSCERPHNIERDVRTKWNSTIIQINSIIRCQAAILEWQRHKRYGIDRVHYLDQSDLDLACDLAEVLNLFHKITLQISKAGSA